MLRKILTFFQKETVLSISAILAILSMFIVHPSGKYFSYIFSDAQSSVLFNVNCRRPE